jgi:AraC family transcriptional regulator
MISQGGLHRVSINRTAHQSYAYRIDGAPFRSVQRRKLTLGFQPASTRLEVEGDAAEYISIFQHPELYRSVGGASFDLDLRSIDALSATADATTLQVAVSLATAAGESGGGDPLLMEHLGLALACCVSRLLHVRLDMRIRSMTAQRLARVVDYIEVALGRADLTVEHMAAVAHLSPYHFSRTFKQATGAAPHRFVLERRVRRAQRHLAHGNESLSAIALASGFSSQAHFSSAFKRFVGVTPGEYRAQVSARN